jgi:hypothetical protein
LPEYSIYSFEQVRIAQEFLTQNAASIASGSCPVGLDKSSKQCTGMMKMPPFSACRSYSSSQWETTLKKAKTDKLSAEDIAKNVIKNVPYKDIKAAYDSL